MNALLSFIFAPALISLAVSLYANKVLEAKRARRDHITKLFETTREEVRKALEVSLDYFAAEPGKRTALQEAKVIAADRELRSAMPIILDPHPELSNSNRQEAKSYFQDLLAELTGGNFQVTDGEVDRSHMKRLTFAAAGLRSQLARMRDAELKTLAATDLVQRGWSRVLRKLDQSAGLPPLIER